MSSTNFVVSNVDVPRWISMWTADTSNWQRFQSLCSEIQGVASLNLCFSSAGQWWNTRITKTLSSGQKWWTIPFFANIPIDINHSIIPINQVHQPVLTFMIHQVLYSWSAIYWKIHAVAVASATKYCGGSAGNPMGHKTPASTACLCFACGAPRVIIVSVKETHV